MIDYTRSLLGTMLEAHDRLYIESADFARTITIPTLQMRATDFGLPRDQAMALYESGRKAAEQFLQTLKWQHYA